MDKPTRIAELADIITQYTSVVDAHIKAKNGCELSFEADGSATCLMDPSMTEPRQAILDATDELHDLLQGPVGILTKYGGLLHNTGISLHAIYKFGIATSFPEGKDRATFAEISSAVGLSEDIVRRILRSAMSQHIYCEPEKGVVAHNAASKLLASNHLTRQWIGMVAEEMWPAAVKTADALKKWLGSEEPEQAGYNLANSTDKVFFEVTAQDPARARRYGDAMACFSASPGFEPYHVAKHYPWGDLAQDSLVVDIGGSFGHVSVAIAKEFPALRFMVQDRIEVIEEARRKLPAEFSKQIEFMEHDFFTTQPVKNADVYLMRWILHDWSDTYAVKILRALIPALKPGAKIVLNEYIVPEVGTVPAFRERLMRSFDLAMLEAHNGKERDMDDWMWLCKRADPRFRLVQTHQPPHAILGVIEIAWDG